MSDSVRLALEAANAITALWWFMVLVLVLREARKNGWPVIATVTATYVLLLINLLALSDAQPWLP